MMRTVTLTKLNNTHRLFAVMIILLALLFAFGLITKPVHAADTYTLSGQYTLDENYTDIKKLPDKFEPATFDLYKVGSFTTDGSVAKLDSPYDEIQLGPLPLKTDDQDEVTWTKECLDYANTLSNYVPKDADYTIDVAEDGTFTKSGLPRGIYLLKGDSQLVKDYPEAGTDSYWCPQPMIFMVFENDVELNVKPMITDKVKHFSVRKTWVYSPGEGDKVRPDTIKVNIFFEGDLRYTEVLDDSNNWCFKWEAGQGEDDPSDWTVQEEPGNSSADKKKFEYFTLAVDGSKGEPGDFTITNKYSIEPTGKTEPTETTEPTEQTEPDTVIEETEPTEGTEPSEDNDKTSKTGDPFSATKYILMMAAALLIIIIVLLGRKKRKNEPRT